MVSDDRLRVCHLFRRGYTIQYMAEVCRLTMKDVVDILDTEIPDWRSKYGTIRQPELPRLEDV